MSNVKEFNFKRTPKMLEVDQRRLVVASLLVRGDSYREMADKVGVKSTQTIWADVQAILDEWRKYHMDDINRYMLVELRKTMEIDKEAWLAWERSKLDKQRIRTTEAIMDAHGDEIPFGSAVVGLIPTERQTTLEGRSGDPAYLLVIDKMIDKRARLLGLYAPERMQMTDSEDMGDSGDQAKATLLGKLLSRPANGSPTNETGQSD